MKHQTQARKMLSSKKMKDADAMKHTPSTIAVASTKGGSGKSTITTALAVQAAKEGPGCIGRLGAAKLAEPLVDDARKAGRDDIEPAAALRSLAGECDWLFLDTAPAMMDQVESAVQAADFVLIPVLASAFDLVAVRPGVALCDDHRTAMQPMLP
jgi:chromosome partitioning protein